MTGQKRYEQYQINPTVLAKADFAFREYFWQRGVELPDDAAECLKDALEESVRAAVNSGRSSGWFVRDGAVGGVKSDFRVHMFSGEGEGEGDALPARKSKYGFEAMQVGVSYVIETDDLRLLRINAHNYARRHGWRVSVRAANGGAKVTRLV